MNTEPLVSIILPVYNSVSTVKSAIDSVRTQSYDNWELLVVDDGSTDDLGKIMGNYTDKRIKYLVQSQNLGLQKALNYGLSCVKGEYIARIDADDVWFDEDKLLMQVNFLKTNPDHVLVGTNAQIVNSSGVILETYRLLETDAQIRKKMLFKNCFLHPTIMIRSAAVQKAGGYEEGDTVKHIEDYALWLKLGLVGKVANLDQVSTRLLVHSSSVTYQNRVVQAKRIRALIVRYRHRYPYFIAAYILLCVRIIGFRVLMVIPIPKRVLYRIQKIYKEF